MRLGLPSQLYTPQSTHRVAIVISGVHYIMMEKYALAGEGGGARPPFFTLVSITYKVAAYATAERQIHSPYIISAPICTLWDTPTLMVRGTGDTSLLLCPSKIFRQTKLKYS